MDLIGSVKYIENRLGEQKSSQGKKQVLRKNTRIGAVDEKGAQADTNFCPTEYDARLGQKVDTTA